MELYDEVEKKKSKVPMILGISIAVLVVLTILIIVAIVYLKSTITTIKINGVRNTKMEDMLYIEQTENGLELYLPILKMAELLDYKGYIGDYKNKSEDKSKCHVTCQNETAMFALESDILLKISNNSEYEYIKLNKDIFEKDGELYTTVEGIEKAFNVLFYYDNQYKNIQIYSMDFLLKTHATNLKLQNYSKDFTDNKAILEGFIIIEQNSQFGVFDIKSKKNVLETKYQEIRYLPATKEFLVKSNGKYGVVTKEAAQKLDLIYDEIKTIDNRKGLYLVKQNNVYGIVNTEGDVIIEPEYKQIGINDLNKFAKNGVENRYILLDEIIPVQNSAGLWGFFNIKGEKIVDFKYNGIGCQSLPISNTYATVVIPSYKVIVVKVNKNYGLISLDGEELLATNVLNSVYLKTDITTGQNKYYLSYSNNTKTVDAEKILESLGK